MPGIVVGVDGSDHSRRALIWAMRQAAQQHVTLTVLAVRPDPARPVTGVYWEAHAYPENSHDPEVARKAIQGIAEQGSVSSKVTHHAACPVVVIREKAGPHRRATWVVQSDLLCSQTDR